MKKITHLKTEFGTNLIISKKTTWYLFGFIPVFTSIMNDENKQL